ncbi:MAG: hypothetical protein P4L87_25515 [Formivibrio sp.]|nr:hypothetical protein [Formivibrio sp.]
MNTVLPTPTVELVEAECSAYDLDPSNQLGDKALKELLEQFPRNTVISQVLLKVLVLDRLYSTRIRNIDVEPLARHIAGLDIDTLLNQGSPVAVERIFVCPELRRKYYSFATKFCSWHRPEDYPLYDSYAVECLWAYKKQDSFHKFHRQDLWYYEKLVTTVTAFRHWYNLDCLTFRQIDKFLWRCGGRIIREAG